MEKPSKIPQIVKLNRRKLHIRIRNNSQNKPFVKNEIQ